jgi:hypothetical protein
MCVNFLKLQTALLIVARKILAFLRIRFLTSSLNILHKGTIFFITKDNYFLK